MKHTMPEEKKSTKSVLVDRKKLKRAQRLIKDNLTSWPWKLCMHMVKQAYGVECDEPMPELGDRNGNFICTRVDLDTGEYEFLFERTYNHRVMNGYELVREVRHV